MNTKTSKTYIHTHTATVKCVCERKRDPLIRNIWMDFMVYARVNAVQNNLSIFAIIRSRNKQSHANTNTYINMLVTCMYCAQFHPIDSLTECRSCIGFLRLSVYCHSLFDWTIDRSLHLSHTQLVWPINRSKTNKMFKPL